MDFEKQPETLEMPTYMANHYVELNPDTGSCSGHPEWCYVCYDHTYHPLRASQFELQWMVTTIEIFHQVIQGWIYHTIMCGFTLIAAPMLHSLPPSGLGSSAHPFRCPLFIPLRLPPSIPDLQLPQFELITRVLSEIINSTGFLLDPGSRQKDSNNILSSRHQPGDFLSIISRFYIHHSDCFFIQLVCESITTDHGDSPIGDQALLGYDAGQTPKAMELRHTQEKHDQQRQQLHVQGSHGGQQQTGFTALPRSSSRQSGSLIELKGRWLMSKVEQNMRCGLYWHRNYLLPKKKSMIGTLGADQTV